MRAVRCTISQEMSEHKCKECSYVIARYKYHDIVLCKFESLPYCEFYLNDVDSLNKNGVYKFRDLHKEVFKNV